MDKIRNPRREIKGWDAHREIDARGGGIINDDPGKLDPNPLDEWGAE